MAGARSGWSLKIRRTRGIISLPSLVRKASSRTHPDFDVRQAFSGDNDEADLAKAAGTSSANRCSPKRARPAPTSYAGEERETRLAHRHPNLGPILLVV